MGNFTDTYIRSLKPQTKRYEEYEGGGFGIRITPKGVKTLIYRYKMDGQTDKHKSRSASLLVNGTAGS